MGRPTEEAEEQFKQAHALIRNAKLTASKDSDVFQQQLANSLSWFYGGCFSLSQGVRATYILLEKVNRRLDALERDRRKL